MLPDKDRYVLIRLRPDGSPLSVQPVENLQDGRKKLVIKLASADCDGWRLFDCAEDKFIDLE